MLPTSTRAATGNKAMQMNVHRINNVHTFEHGIFRHCICLLFHAKDGWLHTTGICMQARTRDPLRFHTSGVESFFVAVQRRLHRGGEEACRTNTCGLLETVPSLDTKGVVQWAT